MNFWWGVLVGIGIALLPSFALIAWIMIVEFTELSRETKAPDTVPTEWEKD